VSSPPARPEPAVERALESLGVSYEVIEIDPAWADTADFCERYGYPAERSANTIIVVGKKKPRRYAAAVVRATCRLDVNHKVKELLGGGRVSFARPEETAELTGMQIGGVTLLGLPDELPLYVDAGLMECEWVILGGGNRSTKIKVGPEVFSKLPKVRIVDALVLES
jgi:prolyl-tRNA editing enzyme YbaK/EbsC (Cys-tRNA(Pro) deacylase)